MSSSLSLPNQPAAAVKPEKIVSLGQAIDLIKDNDVVTTAGFVGTGFPEELAIGLKEKFLKTGSPGGLTLVYAAGQGDGSSGRGVDHFQPEGLLGKVIGGHWGLVPGVQRLALANKVQGYALPQGCISHLYREIAAGRPGLITQVGLGTFVDPRNGGGKINESTTEDIVELIELGGQEYLWYKAFPIDVALIRGTTADPDGNISMEKEALYLDSLAQAMAARNSGGLVICQVERVCRRGAMPSRQVHVPGILVDCVVVAKPENHWQNFIDRYDPSLSGEIKIPMSDLPRMELDERKIIGRRAAFELTPNSVVNLGIGMPEAVSLVANEEEVLDFITLTAEPGVIGGAPAGGVRFGSAYNTDCLIPQNSQFDFYDGGGLDAAFLGMAQMDRSGNVNVSRFGTRLTGAGGFINISQNAKRVVFMGTMTAGGLEVEIGDSELRIVREGKSRKMVEAVAQNTFSSEYAVRRGQPVSYVTERAVFELTPQGVELVEVAPGIDIDRDILAQMDFEPIINGRPTLMNRLIFRDRPMGLKNVLFDLPLDQRLTYDPESDIFFVNFEGYRITSPAQIEAIRQGVAKKVEPLGRRVKVVVNYDNFHIRPELMNDYAAMVGDLMDRYYAEAVRHSANVFLRLKLGETLAQSLANPNMVDSREEATRMLNKGDGR